MLHAELVGGNLPPNGKAADGPPVKHSLPEPLAFSRAELEDAAKLVHARFAPTPLYRYPQLDARVGADVYVKHENHTPVGAFKIRGGIVLMDWLRRTHPEVRGVITATRGNHGQSIAVSARDARLTATIVVPHGNSVEKNAAMKAQGGELIVAGDDFQAAYEHAARIASERDLFTIGPFHRELVRGVATYGLELFGSGVAFDTVYVPIGMGSGICGLINARDALGLSTHIVGVVAEGAPAYARSFAQRTVVSTDAVDTFVDGVACRVPVPEAVATIVRGAARVIAVSDAAVAEAMRILYRDVHNVAEPGGAIALAGLLSESPSDRGRTAAIILSGGNVDANVFVDVLGQQGATKSRLR